MRSFRLPLCRLVILLLATTLVAVTGCSGGEKGGQSRPPLLVETAPATKEIVATSVEITGRAVPSLVADVAAEIDGRVVAFPLYEGAAVTKGERVVFLDCAEPKLLLKERKGRLSRAAADRDRARQAAERAEALRDRNVISEEEAVNARLARDGAEADYALREAEADRAALNVDRCQVKAPFDGKIGARRTDEGRRVAKDDPLFTVVNLDPVEIVAAVPEGHVSALMVGLTARVVFDALPQLSFEGTVIALAPQADPASRTFRVRVEVANPEGRIKGGMQGTVTLPLTDPTPQLVVSRDGIIWKGAQAIVYTVDAEGKAASIPVALGDPFGAGVVATGPGLAEGTPIVVTGAEGLRPGAQVRVVNLDQTGDEAESTDAP